MKTELLAPPEVSDRILDEVYSAVDALMREGCWNVLDDMFIYLETKAWRTPLDILLSYATASFPGKSKIPARKFFMDRCLIIHPTPELWNGLI